MAIPLGIIGGLLGTALSNTFAWLNRKEETKLQIAKMEHETARWVHEKDVIKLGSQADVARIEMSAYAAQVQGSIDGMIASIKDQSIATGRAHRIAASIISLVRPALTFMLLFTVWAIVIWAIGQFKLYGQAEQWRDEIIAIAVLSLSTILELCSMAVTWWFGDRSIKRGIQNTANGNALRAAGGKF